MWKRDKPPGDRDTCRRRQPALGCEAGYRQTLTWFCLGILSGLLVPGCAVGPDFVPPQPPAATQYTQGEEPAKTVAAAGRSQHFEYGAQIAQDWWRLFQSPQIDQVIKEAVAQNPNLQSAQARLQQNQDNLRAGYGAFFPQVSGGFSYSREKFNPAQFGSTAQSNIFNLYTSSVSVSYLLDVFGGTRRTVEALAAQADYQNYTTQATYLTLLGNVVNAAIAQAGYQASIEATERLIAFQKEQLRITETQFQAGTAPYANVVSVQSQLAATEATLPPIRQNLNKAQHLLAALVGRTPAEWQPPRVDLAEITLPGELPVTLPSELVRQRPDILASEAQMHTASANVGVATAAMFPSFTLSAGYGQTSTGISTLMGTGANFWSAGAALAQPLLRGGTLWFQRKAAIDAYQASLTDYRQVVVSAFQQVADSLRVLQHDAEALQAQSAALDAARQALRLTQSNYQAGLVNYVQMLTADNQYQQARLGYIGAQAQRLQDTAALFVALGGGWWNPDSPMAGK